MKFPLSIADASDHEYVLPGKTILWAAEPYYGNLPNGDFDHFPPMTAIVARYHCEYPGALATFADAVLDATDRVWIVDEFFLDDDNASIQQRRLGDFISWLSNDNFQGNDVRILMKGLNKQGDRTIEANILKRLSETQQAINRKRDYKSAPHCQIEVRFSLNITFQQLHDRFAIIDNELWHFGATVGGFHKQVTAASRGWDAAALQADSFFNAIWNARKIEGKQK